MYIRTEYAWYILDTPARAYLPFYTRYWLKHRLAHLVISACLDDPEITRSAFVASLKGEASARDVLGRFLKEADLDASDVVRRLCVWNVLLLIYVPLANLSAGNLTGALPGAEVTSSFESRLPRAFHLRHSLPLPPTSGESCEGDETWATQAFDRHRERCSATSKQNCSHAYCRPHRTTVLRATPACCRAS